MQLSFTQFENRNYDVVGCVRRKPTAKVADLVCGKTRSGKEVEPTLCVVFHGETPINSANSAATAEISFFKRYLYGTRLSVAKPVNPGWATNILEW